MIGGIRKKQAVTKGTVALLNEIWRIKGGIAKVARDLEVIRQAPINWRNRGKVPLMSCKHIAFSLKIPIWGLNYEDLVYFYCDKVPPSWPETVKMYGLDSNTVKYILSLEHPNI